MKAKKRKEIHIRDWIKDKEHISYYETEESKRLTRLFWKNQDRKYQLKDMGFEFG
ncbi:MAG: hypothetical protein PHZ02_01390 [Desulfocapsaceae bacterium]|nr:hypothetical protein [Desulfocapsaceae bacterium]